MLHFAAAYGFRNIQNLVRKIKQGKCEYQFVEIMACPAGCLNGGGQIKPRKGQTAKDLIQHLEAAYLHEVRTDGPKQWLWWKPALAPWAISMARVGTLPSEKLACRCPCSEPLTAPGGCGPILIACGTLVQVTIRDPADNPLVQELYRTWLGAPYSEAARKLLHTQYHERERTVTASISNW